MTAFWCGTVRTGTPRSPVFAETSVPFKTRFSVRGAGLSNCSPCIASAATGSSISSVHSTAKTAAPLPPKSTDEALEDVALVTLAYRSANLPASGDGASFGSRHVVAPEASGDYLELFDALWEAVVSVERDWVLFKPEGFHPTQGFAGELRRAMQNEPDCHVFAVRSQERGCPADEWAAYAKDLRGTLCQPRDPGLLLARRSWLMQQPWRPADCLSYWTWILLVQALSEGVAGVVATPVVLRDKTPAITNICSEYASWAKQGRETGRVALSGHPMATPEHRRICVCCGATARASRGGLRLDGERSYGYRQWEREHQHRCRRPAGAGAAFGLQLFILAADIAATHRG